MALSPQHSCGEMGRRKWRSSKSSLAAGFGEQETVPPTGQKVRTDVSHDMGSSIHTRELTYLQIYKHIHHTNIHMSPHRGGGGRENQRKIKFLMLYLLLPFYSVRHPSSWNSAILSRLGLLSSLNPSQTRTKLVFLMVQALSG